MTTAITYREDDADVDWSALKSTLAEDKFDNGRTPDQLRESFANSTHCVFAWVDRQILGTARALSDGVCNAYVVDVWTQSAFRRQGVATHMVSLLLSHLNGQHVYLFTDDTVEFYEKLGFQRQPVGLGQVVGAWLNRGIDSI